MHFEKFTLENTETFIQRFSSKSDLLVLNSSKIMEGYGRYSYICFDAFATFIAKEGRFIWNGTPLDIPCPFEFIQRKIDEYDLQKNPLLPPFQGGAAGYFGYEASHYIEALPPQCGCI